MTTAVKTMTTREVADRFYELAEQGNFEQILTDLYDEHAKSIEPANSPWQNVESLESIRAKGAHWQAMIHEMHGGYTNKPDVAGKYFVCTMGMDVTLKGQPRMKLDEVALYEVRNGKIVLEQFFF